MNDNLIILDATLKDGTTAKVIYSTLVSKVSMILVPSEVLGVRAMHSGDWHKDISPQEWAYIKSAINKELKHRESNARREQYFQLLRAALAPQHTEPESTPEQLQTYNPDIEPTIIMHED